MNREFQHRNLPMLLLRARESSMRYFLPSLKKHGLTEQQWRVIRVLNDFGKMETGRIAEEACILAPSLSGVLERMQAGGLIERHRPQSDQRKVYVNLTAHSKKLVQQISPEIEARYQQLSQLMCQQDLMALYALLDKLIELPRPTQEPAQARRQMQGQQTQRPKTTGRIRTKPHPVLEY